jgi:seryl-tRNA synthetase
MDDAIDSLERSAGLSATDQEKYYQESEGAVRERMTKLREFRDQNAPTEEMGRRRERQEELDRLQEAYNARTEELNRSTTNFTKVRDERDQYREAAARLEAQMQETIQTQQAALADMQRKIDEAAEAAMAKVRVQAEASYARAQQAVDKVLSHEISMPSARSAVSSVRSSVTTAHSASTAATGSARIVWQTPVQQGDGYVYVGKYVGQYAGDVSGKAAGSEVCRITWSPSKGTILRTAKGERACKNVAEAKLIAQGGI